MVAGLEKSQVDQSNGALAPGRENRVRARLELADTRRKLENRRRAVKPIGIPNAILIPAVVDRGCGREQCGRTAKNGACQGVIALGDCCFGMNQFRLPAFVHGDQGGAARHGEKRAEEEAKL